MPSNVYIFAHRLHGNLRKVNIRFWCTIFFFIWSFYRCHSKHLSFCILQNHASLSLKAYKVVLLKYYTSIWAIGYWNKDFFVLTMDTSLMRHPKCRWCSSSVRIPVVTPTMSSYCLQWHCYLCPAVWSNSLPYNDINAP